VDHFVTQIFPDTSLLDLNFIKLCLVYFDKILVHVPTDVDYGVVEEYEKSFREVCEKENLDLDGAINKYRHVLKTIDQLKSFEKDGIVKCIPSQTALFAILRDLEKHDKVRIVKFTNVEQLDYQKHKRNEIVDRILTAPVHSENLTSIVVDTVNNILENHESVEKMKSVSSVSNTWAFQRFSVCLKDRICEHGDSIEYLLNYLHRLLSSTTENFQLTTNSIEHFDVMKDVQKFTVPQTHKPLRIPITDLIRITAPYLVAHDFIDILEIRSKLSNFLDPFRYEVQKLIADVPHDVSNLELITHFQRIVDKEINPKLSELKRYLSKPESVLEKHLVSGFSSISTAVITIVGTTLTDLNTSLFVAPFVHLLASALKGKQEMSEKKLSNPFTFLVLAENYLQKTK